MAAQHTPRGFDVKRTYDSFSFAVPILTDAFDDGHETIGGASHLSDWHLSPSCELDSNLELDLPFGFQMQLDPWFSWNPNLELDSLFGFQMQLDPLVGIQRLLDPSVGFQNVLMVATWNPTGCYGKICDVGVGSSTLL